MIATWCYKKVADIKKMIPAAMPLPVPASVGAHFVRESKVFSLHKMPNEWDIVAKTEELLQ